MTRAIVLPDELDEPFGDAETQEWERDPAPIEEASYDDASYDDASYDESAH